MNAARMSMQPGFSDPVLDGQASFRALMDALARPGRVTTAGAGLAPPEGLMPGSAATLLAMCDFETRLWTAPSFAGGEAAGYLRFHTGAPLVAEAGKAMFALLDARHDALTLADFAQGDPEYPDRSTTIVVQVESVTAGPSRLAAGPGIAGVATLAVSDLPDDFAEQWAANRLGFPLGVDLIFVAGHYIVALPRSARLIGEGG